MTPRELENQLNIMSMQCAFYIKALHTLMIKTQSILVDVPKGDIDIDFMVIDRGEYFTITTIEGDSYIN